MALNKFRDFVEDGKKRKYWLLICVALGSIIGSISSCQFGSNLKTTEIVIPKIGVLHYLSLPKGVVSRSDIQSFEINIPSADDFVRVFVNNYLVASNENPESLIHFTNLDEDIRKEAKLFLQKFAINRGHSLENIRADFYLHDGLNHIVIELENGDWGFCNTRYDIRVNGVILQGYPSAVPYPQNLPNEMSELLGPTIHGWNNAICSRRIFQFTLKK